MKRGARLEETSIDLRLSDKLAAELRESVERGDVKAVAAGIGRGADVNAVDAQRGKTPLNLAASAGHVEVVKCLLSAAADVNTVNKFDQTALHKAAFEGHTAIVRILLTMDGIDLNAKNEHGMTPLHWAAVKDRVEVARDLLAAGAHMDIADESGKTAADLAV